MALGLSAVLLLVCAGTLIATVRFVRDAERATGTVVDVDTQFSDGDSTYYPVVRYTTADGRTITFTSRSGSSSEPAEGDNVEVLYDPDDPSDAQLSGFFSIWLWPLASGTLGIMAAVFGLFAPRFGLFARRAGSPLRLERR